ncbi:MAG: SHD1 domain-containing protein [Pirellulaceae bacterium]|nr:SHD1 domain-containing protein [Pirellulaceae bacterium]
MKIFCILFFAAVLWLQDDLRTWTDSSGKFQVDAALVSSDGEKVTLRKADGKIIVVEISRLSAESQKFLKREAVGLSAEQAPWKDNSLAQQLAQQIESGLPPKGFSQTEFERLKNDAGDRFERIPGVIEHQQRFKQLILRWVDDHQGQPLPTEQVMSGWLEETRAELRKELVASPEVQAVLTRMNKLKNPGDAELAALVNEFERVGQQWTLRQMDADKLLAKFDGKYQQWLLDSREVKAPATAQQLWQEVAIPGIGKFAIPPTMEIQGGLYSGVIGGLRKGIFGPDELMKRIVIQPQGLNDFKGKAQDTYARFIVEVLRNSEESGLEQEHLRAFSPADLEEVDELLKQALIEQLEEGSKLLGKEASLLEWHSVSIARFNHIYALNHGYRRQLGDNPSVVVQEYLVPIDDILCKITVSYRESERSKWAADLENVISSFEFDLQQK